jgi:hypothetical protein
VRENRPLRLTRRGLETWNGRDMVALADERASNSEHKHRPTPARQPSTLPISGMWKRSYGSSIETPPDERGGHSCDEPTATAPHLDFTAKSSAPPWRRHQLQQHSILASALGYQHAKHPQRERFYIQYALLELQEARIAGTSRGGTQCTRRRPTTATTMGRRERRKFSSHT